MDATQERVLKRIDDMAGEIIEEAAALIRVESVNPKYP